MGKHTSIPPGSRLGLNRVEAAEYIGVSPSLFDELVRDGRMPSAKPVNARRVWSRLEIEACFAALNGDGHATEPDDEIENPYGDCE